MHARPDDSVFAQRDRARSHRDPAMGFTLVEIMIVVVIIGLLAAIAIPAFERVQTKAKASRLANDFRQFHDAFQRYNLDNGGWPPAQTTPGPATGALVDYLPSAWGNASPLGGAYTWSGSTGRIRLRGTSASTTVMQGVDAIIDDGDLTTGDFTAMVGSGNYHYQLH